MDDIKEVTHVAISYRETDWGPRFLLAFQTDYDTGGKGGYQYPLFTARLDNFDPRGYEQLGQSLARVLRKAGLGARFYLGPTIPTRDISQSDNRNEPGLGNAGA